MTMTATRRLLPTAANEVTASHVPAPSRTYDANWAQKVTAATFKEMNSRRQRLARDHHGLEGDYRYSKELHHVTAGLLNSLAMDIAVLEEKVADVLEQAFSRIAELEARLQGASQQGKALPYQGVHKSDREYFPGEFVTFAGSLWHCNVKTNARPGDEASEWTLAVKRGRDGKGVVDAA